MKTVLNAMLGGALLLTAGCTNLAVAGTPSSPAVPDAPADLIVTDATIYTADAGRRTVEALAVRDGRILYTGDAAGAMALAGPDTKIERLGGKLVLPGLIDMHIHPLGIVDSDSCDLKNEAKSLAALSEFVKGCIDRLHIPEGEWVLVDLWNFSQDNRPDPKHPTIRAALDAASTKHPIKLFGSDGHHTGFNSTALSMARNEAGAAVGLSARTLASEFSSYKKLVGVDSRGEPDGYITESAANLMPAPGILELNYKDLMKDPARVTLRLNASGITAVQDAMATPESMTLYDALDAAGKLTAHVRVAQFYDFGAYKGAATGRIDFDRMVSDATARRAKYRDHPMIRADAVKLFADGVLEGNPMSVPPTLPNGAMLKPYLQPIFGKDDTGAPTVTGYVDTASALCAKVRANRARYAGQADAFRKANGYDPGQCEISSGTLEHPEADIMEFARRFHQADFTLHIHAIGDRAVHVALNAIEAARASDGVSSQPDALAHIQLVSPEDAQRFGKNRIFATLTFAWANAFKSYDMSVMPFVDRVHGNSDAAFYSAGNYVFRQSYAAKQIRDAGGLLLAGSDAPVETRDPRPFYNIQYAITRQHPGLPQLNSAEAIGIGDAIDAYTVNGARAMRMEQRIGSLEPGKDADFIIVDRNILDMAKDDAARQTIKDTKVLEAWLGGRRVFQAQ